MLLAKTGVGIVETEFSVAITCSGVISRFSIELRTWSVEVSPPVADMAFSSQRLEVLCGDPSVERQCSKSGSPRETSDGNKAVACFSATFHHNAFE